MFITNVPSPRLKYLLTILLSFPFFSVYELLVILSRRLASCEVLPTAWFTPFKLASFFTDTILVDFQLIKQTLLRLLEIFLLYFREPPRVRTNTVLTGRFMHRDMYDI